VRGPDGGAAARGIVAGPSGYAAGFARVSPSSRYTTAVGVRGNFTGYGLYHAGWYTAHPGAWYAAGWAPGAAWRTAIWNGLGSWLNYWEAPAYYDYGNSIVYQDNSVYVNGQDAGTSAEYYNQAAALAQSGAEATTPGDDQWLPLGVFALTEASQTRSAAVVQLAINKQGMLRGNYTNTTDNQTLVIHGSLDKKTQRVAFTAGDYKTAVFETGLYNLTKDEAPLLIHYGQDRTEQWLLVRMASPEQQKSAQ
jgi:hypothetical protein